MFLYYCSSECREKDWEAHHKYEECKVFKKIMDDQVVEQFDRQMLAIRVYLTLRGRPELKDKKFDMPDGSTKSFNEIMTNEEHLKNSPGHFRSFLMVSELLLSVVSGFEFQEFFNVFCRVCMNSAILGMTLSMTRQLADCIYMQYSMLNHSCRKNSQPIYKGMNHEVRAISKIKAGEEITTSYIDVLQSREERRRLLRIIWFFDCECIRCQSNDDDIVMEIDSLDVMPLNDRNLEKMLVLLDKILGEYSPKASAICMTFLMENCPLNQKNRSRLLEKAKKVITVALGVDHPFYRILTSQPKDAKSYFEFCMKFMNLIHRAIYGFS